MRFAEQRRKKAVMNIKNHRKNKKLIAEIRYNVGVRRASKAVAEIH